MNGGDVSEGRNLGAGLVPNLDSVEEFRLITNSFDAEYGKFSGAVMNAITKSGTNGFHGDVFEFLRNDEAGCRELLLLRPAKSELRRNQFGFTAGGPFWKDKLFWFTDYQGTRQVQGAEVSERYPCRALPNLEGKFDPALLTGTVDGTAGGSCPACGWPTSCHNGWVTRLRVASHTVSPAALTTANVRVSWRHNSPSCVGASQRLEFSHTFRLPTNPDGTYSNNSQKNTVTDNKIGERVDFNNQKTGNWSFYYHFDDSTVNSALPSGGASVPGFPARDANSRPRVRHQ